jgi:hypothetical protein
MTPRALHAFARGRQLAAQAALLLETTIALQQRHIELLRELRIETENSLDAWARSARAAETPG